jgi:hypothetical protein
VFVASSVGAVGPQDAGAAVESELWWGLPNKRKTGPATLARRYRR